MHISSTIVGRTNVDQAESGIINELELDITGDAVCDEALGRLILSHHDFHLLARRRKSKQVNVIG